MDDTLAVGQKWRDPQGRVLTINEIDGDNIDCNRYDPATQVSDVAVLHPAEFDAFARVA